MTENELTMRHFNANAKACPTHNKPVTIGYDGCWFIECAGGCTIHDGDNASPSPLIRRYMESGFARQAPVC